MSTAKKNKNSQSEVIKEILIYTSLLFIILLTTLNINSYFAPKQIKVLGVETENSEVTFWQSFLAKNPSYIPGWIETGRLDKASEIDPNYFSK